MRRSAAWIAGLIIMLTAAQVWAASEVRGVRLWRAPDNTRLVFDLSGPVQHSVFTLSAPNRIVIDVMGANLRTNLSKLALKNTPITGLRAAQRDPKNLRLVLDLSAEVLPKSFTLVPNQEYGHRLVVDLLDKGSDLANDEIMAKVQAASAPKTKVVAAAPTPNTTTASLTPIVTPVSPSLSVTKRQPSSSGRRDIIIALDAGHGGEDPGALGPGGLREKDITLSIVKRLKQLIDQKKGFRAELVRTGDYFIPLRRRTEIARKHGADLFVSIHADAAPRTSAFGASVYALSDRGATSETARWLADAENRSDLIGGTGSLNLGDKDRMLAGVLLDLSMTATLSSSLNVGQKVLDNIGRITPLHKQRVEQAGFMVLKSPDIPSILVETGFISNPDESRKLNTGSHQQALVSSIAAGVTHFFQENPPVGSYIAWLKDSGRLAAGPRQHVVQPGDSLTLLAMRYQVSPESLRSLNRLKGDVIKVGQRLRVPAPMLAGQP